MHNHRFPPTACPGVLGQRRDLRVWCTGPAMVRSRATSVKESSDCPHLTMKAKRVNVSTETSCRRAELSPPAVRDKEAFQPNGRWLFLLGSPRTRVGSRSASRRSASRRGRPHRGRRLKLSRQLPSGPSLPPRVCAVGRRRIGSIQVKCLWTRRLAAPTVSAQMTCREEPIVATPDFRRPRRLRLTAAVRRRLTAAADGCGSSRHDRRAGRCRPRNGR